MLKDLVEFERQAKRIDAMGPLTSLTDAVVRSMCCGWFTLIRPRASATVDTSFLLTSYPEGWVEQIFAEHRHIDDPIHAAVLRSIDGVQWRDAGDFIMLTEHQKETLALAGDHGLRNGLTLPFRLTGMPTAMFSVAVPHGSELKPDQVLAAKLLGSIVFVRAQEIIAQSAGRLDVVHLSPRQIDCIRLIAQGLSDHAIAAKLGLSPETVREYVESARQRYGVKRRTQLIVAAIRDGHLNVEEAADWLERSDPGNTN